MPLKNAEASAAEERLAALLVQHLDNNGTPLTEEDITLLCGNERGEVSEEIVQALYSAAQPEKPEEFNQFLESFSAWIERRRTRKEG